ncbi:hypothetical protein WA538_004427 [Blastocystis sp. DL]
MKGKAFVSYYDQALKLLSNRPHAEKELHQKLQLLSTKRWTRRTMKSKMGMESSSIFTNDATPQDDEAEIDAAIQRLKEEGFVNDRDFADWYCMQRESYNPRSQRVLYLELVTKGVDPAVVKSSIQDYHSEEDCCRTLALRKVGALSHEKLVSYLLGKGFRYDTIKTVLKSLPDFSTDC